MIDSSTDILYLVIAGCVGIFTLFLVWALYYVVQILREGYEVIRDVRQKIAEFEDLLHSIREKVFTSATAVSFIAKELGSVIESVRERKDKKATKARRKKSE